MEQGDTAQAEQAAAMSASAAKGINTRLTKCSRQLQQGSSAKMEKIGKQKMGLKCMIIEPKDCLEVMSS